MVSCAVKSCRNNSAKKVNVRFARFPKNENLSKIWLSRCGIKNDTPKDLKNMVICSKHFEKDEFSPNFIVDSKCPTSRRFLKKTAVPTLHLPVAIKASVQSETVSADVATNLSTEIDKNGATISLEEKEMETKWHETQLKFLEHVMLIWFYRMRCHDPRIIQKTDVIEAKAKELADTLSTYIPDPNNWLSTFKTKLRREQTEEERKLLINKSLDITEIISEEWIGFFHKEDKDVPVPSGSEIHRRQLKNSTGLHCCIVSCPTIIDADNIHRMFPFPAKHTAKYDKWLYACIDSAENIERQESPLICPQHFGQSVKLSGELDQQSIPYRNLTEDLNKIVKQEMEYISQLVAQWMVIKRQRRKTREVTPDMVKAKAKEVALVLKILDFDPDLGWLSSFEKYLTKNRIASINKITKKIENEQILPDDDYVEWVIPQKGTTDLESCEMLTQGMSIGTVDKENEQDIAIDLEPDFQQSIQTYEEALENMKLLEDYAKRMKDEPALELVENIQTILLKALK